MSECLYTVQGKLVCREQFIRAETREPFVAGINTRPNEVSSASQDVDNTLSSDILRQAIQNGCSIVYEQNRGYNISNCNKPS